MKIRKFLILLPMVSAMVVMIVSCGYKQPTYTWPSRTIPTPVPPIATTMIEVTGHQGDTLRVEFNRETGECKGLLVNNKEYKCDDENIVIPLEKTYFCTPPYAKHPANTDIDNDGKLDVYCGIVHFLTEGADIQFMARSATGNRMCKVVGGDPICWPPN